MWRPLELAPGASDERELGTLNLRVRREPDEAWVHASNDGLQPAGPDWTRWSLERESRIEVLPVLPDRPVVVSPELPFYLPPQGIARVFVRVPLFVRLDSIDPSGNRQSLGEFPTVVLSDTWWGGYTEGALAYWLTTRARRHVTNEVFEPHLAICPLVLINEFDQPLPVERFTVRVAYLTLFGRGDAVWTDEVQVRYRGFQEGSEIRYTGRVPDIAGELDLLSPHREKPPRGLHAKTFGRFRALSGWG